MLFVVGASQGSAVKADGASVVIYGTKVLTMRSSVGSTGPKARATILAANIQKTSKTGDVRVENEGKNFLIVVDGRLVLTVTKPEAKLNSSSPQTLANLWARNIRKALLTPPLRIDTDSLRVPLGASRVILASGAQFGQAQIQATDSKVLKVGRAPNGIAYKAIGFGQTEVVVSVGSIVKTISVSVMPMGANLPQNLVAIVSGNPASVDTVEGAIESAVRTQLGADPKSELKIKFPQATQVLPGESRRYTAQVRAVGSEVLPAEGPVFVTVKNVALGRKPESELWYCNEPENLKKPGLLFVAPLRPETPSRMLYHHINMMSRPLVVMVEAINDSDQPALLMVIPGDSKPDKNPVLAGVQAADQFMKGWTMSSGEVISIPPRSRLPIAMRRIASGQTMSGLCYLRLLDDGPDQVTIRTEARPPFPLDAKWLAATQSGTPWRHIGAQRMNNLDHDPILPSIHIYPNPYKEENGTYQVGGKYAFFRIGERPIARADKLDKLSGNFGVTYTIKALVENPTAFASEIEVVFEASAGYSGAVFYVNGQYVKTPLLQPKTEAQIAKFTVEPGAFKNLSIITVPLSGSSYPATLTIRPVDVGAQAKIVVPKR
ncbi:MAG: hypothetical protein H7Y17_00330 [Chlorobia bacterium]|nr:hypothetical protein [Fimbriimonadaceae bacterium]